MVRISGRERRFFPRYKQHYQKHVARHGVESESQLAKRIIGWIFQPKFTIALIIANIAVYFWSQTWAQEFFDSLIFRPAAIYSLNFMPVISSWFLHANPAHLIGNLIFLFVFGRVVERRFGAAKTAFIYFGAAIISDLISGLVFQQGGIGASGAIAGLIAAAVIADPFYLNYIVFGLPIPIVVLGWVAIFTDILGLIQPIQSNIGHIAHLAGFFGISLLVFLINSRDKKIRTGFFINVLTVAAGLVIYFMFPDIARRILEYQ